MPWLHLGFAPTSWPPTIALCHRLKKAASGGSAPTSLLRDIAANSATPHPTGLGGCAHAVALVCCRGRQGEGSASCWGHGPSPATDPRARTLARQAKRVRHPTSSCNECRLM